MPASVSRLLHPRLTRSNAEYEPSGLCADVFAMVVERGPTHPSDLTQLFGVLAPRTTGAAVQPPPPGHLRSFTFTDCSVSCTGTTARRSTNQ
jgi:hypothetical protein